MTADCLPRAFEDLRAEGTRLAGGLMDLPQRAAVYHHVFLQSGGNHAFPLIAAHGALWARSYFRFGLALGHVLSAQYALTPQLRRDRLRALHEFADVFRDVNRCVCVDTYANFHFTARFGEHPDASRLLDAKLLDALNLMHRAKRTGRSLDPAEKRSVFEAHFLHEQEHVVGPRIESAAAGFDWPLVKWLALQPVIRFAYFPSRRWLWFRNFASRSERIERGLQAFDTAAAVGWDHTAASLARYAVLPQSFFTDPVEYFGTLRHAVLAA